MKSITDNKEFWKTIKPLLRKTVTAQTNISFVEKGKLLLNKTKIAKRFSDFFKNSLNQLGINRDEAKSDEPGLSKNLAVAIQKLKTHSSIKSIRDNINLSDIIKRCFC